MKEWKVLNLVVCLLLCTALCSCDLVFQGTLVDSGDEVHGQYDDERSSTISNVEENVSRADIAQESMDYVYTELLKGIDDLILFRDSETDMELATDAQNGIIEAGYSKTPEETLECVGYALCDLNADGMPELIIGGISEEIDGQLLGRDIYAVYTYVQEEIKCVCSGWSRNYVGWMGENVFYYRGSGGALYTIIGQYELLPNAGEWTCMDLYFTDENGIYHNQTGSYDIESAEVTDMPLEELWELADALESKVLEFEMKPFSGLKY